MKTRTNHGAEIALPVTLVRKQQPTFYYADDVANFKDYWTRRGLNWVWCQDVRLTAETIEFRLRNVQPPFIVLVLLKETLPRHVAMRIEAQGGIIATERLFIAKGQPS